MLLQLNQILRNSNQICDLSILIQTCVVGTWNKFCEVRLNFDETLIIEAPRKYTYVRIQPVKYTACHVIFSSAYCGLGRHMTSKIWINIGLGNSLLRHGTMPLSDQWWLIIKHIQWQSPKSNFTRDHVLRDYIQIFSVCLLEYRYRNSKACTHQNLTWRNQNVYSFRHHISSQINPSICLPTASKNNKCLFYGLLRYIIDCQLVVQPPPPTTTTTQPQPTRTHPTLNLPKPQRNVTINGSCYLPEIFKQLLWLSFPNHIKVTWPDALRRLISPGLFVHKLNSLSVLSQQMSQHRVMLKHLQTQWWPSPCATYARSALEWLMWCFVRNITCLLTYGKLLSTHRFSMRVLWTPI